MRNAAVYSLIASENFSSLNTTLPSAFISWALLYASYKSNPLISSSCLTIFNGIVHLAIHRRVRLPTKGNGRILFTSCDCSIISLSKQTATDT